MKITDSSSAVSYLSTLICKCNCYPYKQAHLKTGSIYNGVT